MASARKTDENGYITIENNPISRSGVFQYLGSSIGAPEPNKVYNVYRPAEELADAECLKSFHLLPLVDDHTMLGRSADGLTPAEKKGTHGITGQDVDFRDGVLYATIKIFSETLADLIAKGKTNLSLGYRCMYEKASGVFAGQAYEYVQRSLRGNHIALVDVARCDVEVLDHSITAFDSFDLSITPSLTHTKKEFKMDEELKARLDATDAAIANVLGVVTAFIAKDSDDEPKDDKKGEDEKEDKKAEDGDDDSKEDKKDDKGMDAADASILLKRIAAQDAEIAGLKKGAFKAVMSEAKKRDDMAKALSFHVGAFDASEMSLDEVAKYGVKELKMECADGQEAAVIAGFLKGSTAKPAQKSEMSGMDAAQAKAGADVLASFSAPKE